MATIAEALAIAQQHRQAGRLTQAAALCQHILNQQPHHAGALVLVAQIANQVGRYAEAAACYRRVLEQRPDPELYNELGNVLQRDRRFAEAIPHYETAIALQPETAYFYSNLGAALQQLGRYQASVNCYHRAIARHPDYADAYYNLGNLYRSQRHFIAAIHAYSHALALRPHHVDAYNNLGLCFYDQAQPQAAIQAYRQAIALQPEHADAHQNLALALLLAGQLEDGFSEYEWRWQAHGPDNHPLRQVPQPLWDGADLTGKTILLHAEQGFGDTLQFVRYAAWVAQQGGRVILECPSALVRVLTSVPGVSAVIPTGEALPEFDTHAPLMSLPRLMQAGLSTLDTLVPYVTPPAPVWVLPPTTALKVGVVWAGNPNHRNDQARSCPLAEFAPLFQTPHVVFYSLQKGARAAEIAPFVKQQVVHDVSDRLHDFADTAALISQLDLVITVDTAVAHLAGALGKQTWVLLSFAPDWRWQLYRDDSPWYPSMRLFRQTAPSDWAGVILRVVETLHAQARKMG